MAQYQVPQFIEVEDKIVGPLTLKQFLYLAAAGLISFLLFFVLKLWFWFIITALMSITAAVLALGKYNGRPLPQILFAAFKYLLRPRLYLWKSPTEEIALPEIPPARTPAESPLKTLFLKVTTAIRQPKPKPEQEQLEAYRQTVANQQIRRRVDYR